MTRAEIIQRIEEALHKHNNYGLIFHEEDAGEGFFSFTLRLPDLKRPFGFEFLINIFWRRLEISFAPDNFAGSLINQMGCGVEKIGAMCFFWDKICKKGGKMTFIRNKESINPFLTTAIAPSETKELTIKYAETFPDLNLEKIEESIPIVLNRVDSFINIVLCLLPIEDDISLETSSEFNGCELEGKLIISTSKKYERSRVNRAACIRAFGYKCKICGFDFEKIYGDYGINFIEVHHIIPISSFKEEKALDPTKDLITICSNCHSIIHRTYPPIDPEVLIKEVTGKTF